MAMVPAGDSNRFSTFATNSGGGPLPSSWNAKNTPIMMSSGR